MRFDVLSRLLQQIPQFARFSSTEIVELSNKFTEVTFSSFEHVFEQGSCVDMFYIMQAGKVQLTQDVEISKTVSYQFGESASPDEVNSTNSGDQVRDISCVDLGVRDANLGQLQIIGEQCLESDSEHIAPYSVVARSPVRCLCISQALFHRLARRASNRRARERRLAPMNDTYQLYLCIETVVASTEQLFAMVQNASCHGDLAFYRDWVTSSSSVYVAYAWLQQTATFVPTLTRKKQQECAADGVSARVAALLQATDNNQQQSQQQSQPQQQQQQSREGGGGSGSRQTASPLRPRGWVSAVATEAALLQLLLQSSVPPSDAAVAAAKGKAGRSASRSTSRSASRTGSTTGSASGGSSRRRASSQQQQQQHTPTATATQAEQQERARGVSRVFLAAVMMAGCSSVFTQLARAEGSAQQRRQRLRGGGGGGDGTVGTATVLRRAQAVMAAVQKMHGSGRCAGCYRVTRIKQTARGCIAALARFMRDFGLWRPHTHVALLCDGVLPRHFPSQSPPPALPPTPVIPDRAFEHARDADTARVAGQRWRKNAEKRAQEAGRVRGSGSGSGGGDAAPFFDDATGSNRSSSPSWSDEDEEVAMDSRAAANAVVNASFRNADTIRNLISATPDVLSRPRPTPTPTPTPNHCQLYCRGDGTALVVESATGRVVRQEKWQLPSETQPDSVVRAALPPRYSPRRDVTRDRADVHQRAPPPFARAYTRKAAAEASSRRPYSPRALARSRAATAAAAAARLSVVHKRVRARTAAAARARREHEERFGVPPPMPSTAPHMTGGGGMGFGPGEGGSVDALGGGSSLVSTEVAASMAAASSLLGDSCVIDVGDGVPMTPADVARRRALPLPSQRMRPEAIDGKPWREALVRANRAAAGASSPLPRPVGERVQRQQARRRGEAATLESEQRFQRALREGHASPAAAAAAAAAAEEATVAAAAAGTAASASSAVVAAAKGALASTAPLVPTGWREDMFAPATSGNATATTASAATTGSRSTRSAEGSPRRQGQAGKGEEEREGEGEGQTAGSEQEQEQEEEAMTTAPSPRTVAVAAAMAAANGVFPRGTYHSIPSCLQHDAHTGALAAIAATARAASAAAAAARKRELRFPSFLPQRPATVSAPSTASATAAAKAGGSKKKASPSRRMPRPPPPRSRTAAGTAVSRASRAATSTATTSAATAVAGPPMPRSAPLPIVDSSSGGGGGDSPARRRARARSQASGDGRRSPATATAATTAAAATPSPAARGPAVRPRGPPALTVAVSQSPVVPKGRVRFEQGDNNKRNGGSSGGGSSGSGGDGTRSQRSLQRARRTHRHSQQTYAGQLARMNEVATTSLPTAAAAKSRRPPPLSPERCRGTPKQQHYEQHTAAQPGVAKLKVDDTIEWFEHNLAQHSRTYAQHVRDMTTPDPDDDLPPPATTRGRGRGVNGKRRPAPLPPAITLRMGIAGVQVPVSPAHVLRRRPVATFGEPDSPCGGVRPARPSGARGERPTAAAQRQQQRHRSGSGGSGASTSSSVSDNRPKAPARRDMAGGGKALSGVRGPELVGSA